MEHISDDNVKEPMEPVSWAEMSQDIPEAVNVVVVSALGMSPGNMTELPAWYVLTKASGVTGIPIATLYQDPVARQHALAVLAVDSAAMQKLAAYRGKGAQNRPMEGAARAEPPT